MRRWPVPVVGCVSMLTSVLAVVAAAPARASVDGAPDRAALAGLRMPILANEGQADARVAFYAPTLSGTLFVTRRGELVYALPADAPRSGRVARHAPTGDGWTLRETLTGGRVRAAGRDPSATRVSYMLGDDRARWRAGVRAYDRLDLGEVWPGVTVALRARGRGVEKVFTVRPGTPVARIRVRLDGATGLTVDATGTLVVRTGLGPVTFSAPVAYQERAGARYPVDVAYRLEGDGYGFAVGDYDRAAPLVIDPLLQSTYVGGSSTDIPYALAVHPTTGDVYVGGQTSSTNFPHTLGAVVASPGGSGDAFVARLNASLTTFIQATYLGGSGVERVQALAIHPGNGDVYAVGETSSPNFSGAGGGAQPTPGGGTDTFVARLGPALTSLVQATYLGGSSTELGAGLAINAATGDVYVAGSTISANFPRTAGGAQAAPGGSGDAYVARLTASLTTIVQSTYYGGNGTEFGYVVAVHPVTGDVYLGGETPSANLSATSGGAQPTYAGNDDGFVARLSGSLGALLQATYLGGTGGDGVNSLAIHPMTGDVYAAGGTGSTDFPGTAGGAQPIHGGGGGDVFVARLNAALTSILQATYLGGGGSDAMPAPSHGLAIHPFSGSVYVGGYTTSTNFPGTGGGAQATPGGGFVARLSGALTALVQASYVGDAATAIAIHPTTGHAYVTGGTTSAAFPAVAGGAQSTFGGAVDAFVSRFTYSLAAVDGLGLSALANQPTFATGQTLNLSFGVINPGFPLSADFFLGIVRPDGLFEFVTGAGNVVGTLASLTPFATGIPLSAPFAIPLPNLVSHQWTGSEPHGTYVAVVVAYGGGQILGVATASYSYP